MFIRLTAQSKLEIISDIPKSKSHDNGVFVFEAYLTKPDDWEAKFFMIMIFHIWKDPTGID